MKNILNKVTLEEMKKEATVRIKMLEKMDGIDWVTKWWRQGKMSFSRFTAIGSSVEDAHIFGTVFTINEDEVIKKAKEEFEKRTGYLAYYGIVTPIGSEKLISFLYVSTEKEEWKDDRQELEYGVPYAFSSLAGSGRWDVGVIQVKMEGGGLIRIR